MVGEPWSLTANGVTLTIRLTPKGGRDAIDGVEVMSDGRAVLKVRVRAAPSEGEANAALIRLINLDRLTTRHRRFHPEQQNHRKNGGTGGDACRIDAMCENQPPRPSRNACGVIPVCLRKNRVKCDGSEKARS